jgi:hypothetical protein
MNEEIPFQQMPLEEIPPPSLPSEEELQTFQEGMRKEFFEAQERNKKLREHALAMMKEGIAAAGQSRPEEIIDVESSQVIDAETSQEENQ